MHIRYATSEGKLEGESTTPVGIFMRQGASWFSSFATRQTRYEGWFLGNFDSLPYSFTKVLERIVYGSEAPSGVTIGTDRKTWHYADGTDLSLLLPPLLTNQAAALQIEINHAVPLTLFLDIRGMYQEPVVGRIYELFPDQAGLLIRYTDSLLASPYFLYLKGARTKLEVTPDLWHLVTYPRDAARHSHPDSLYVYSLLLEPSKHITCGVAFNETAARAAAEEGATYQAPESNAIHEVNPEELAAALTQKALADLLTEQGYYAGLPWFHQIWSRDELLLGLGLSREMQYKMITRYLELPLEHGELPTFAGSGTTCADGVGLLALLIREYGLETLDETAHAKVKRFFQAADHGLMAERRAPSGLIYSGHNTTWMDTIGRAGYRIEIQCMYALVLALGGDAAEERQLEMCDTIRHQFYREGYLIDGLHEDSSPDLFKRPNVFLAYLLQPQLLVRQEWQSCFDSILQALGTSWGGLTSLDQNDSAFLPLSTGEDNRSYQQGDSWFFVNNLAALALKRFDSKRYAETISKLLGASTSEILWQHFLGTPGEIASAATGESWGCGIQGFSAGTYLKALLQE